MFQTKSNVWAPLLLLVVITAPLTGEVPSSADKQRNKIKQNPMVREYFREKAIAIQPGWYETKDERMLNSRIDLLIDSFIGKTQKLTAQMVGDAEELKKLSDENLQDTTVNLQRTLNPQLTRSLKEMRIKSGKVRSGAKDLRSELDFLLSALKLDDKATEIDTNSGEIGLLKKEITEIQESVEEFETKINEFFFSGPSSISVEELQKTSLPTLLKKIEKYAERVETTLKRL